MSYEPTIWKKGDKVTSTKLNKIENGIQGNDTEVSQLKEGLTQVTNKMELAQGLNLVNPDNAEANTYYSKGGTRNTNQNNYSAFTMTDPEPGATYSYWKRNGSAVYDEANSKITFVTVYVNGIANESLGATSTHSFTVPSNVNVTKLVFSIYNASGSIAEYGMIVKGTERPSGYVAYQAPHWVGTEEFFPKAMTVYNVKAYGAVGDGMTNDTVAINTAIADGAGARIYIPSGTYMVDGAIVIPSGTMLFGDGADSVLKMSDTYNQYGFTPITWRSNKGTVYSLITTEEDSENIVLRDFSVVGGAKTTVDGIWGITIYKASHCLIENVNVSNINYVADRTGEVYAFGLFIFQSDDVTVKGGKYEYCGYENIGGEYCNHVLVKGCYLGTAWRVPIQFHQGSHDIKIVENTIISTDCAMTHSLITLHGQATTDFNDSVSDVLIDGNYLKGITINSPSTHPYRGGIQSVWQNEQNIKIVNNTFDCSYYCITNATDKHEGTYASGGWLIFGNYIKGSYGINLWDDNVMVKDNIVDSVNTAIAVMKKTSGGNRLVADNFLLNNNTVYDTVTR